MLVGTLICLSAAWLARAQTTKSLQSILSGNGLSSFSLYLVQFPTLFNQLKNGNVTSMFSFHIVLSRFSLYAVDLVN